MDWIEFLQQTGELINAAQDDIRSSEASLRHKEGCRMVEKLDESARQKARLLRLKLQNHHLALRKRREILLDAPDTIPGREDGLQNLDKLMREMKAKLRLT